MLRNTRYHDIFSADSYLFLGRPRAYLSLRLPINQLLFLAFRNALNSLGGLFHPGDSGPSTSACVSICLPAPSMGHVCHSYMAWYGRAYHYYQRRLRKPVLVIHSHSSPLMAMLNGPVTLCLGQSKLYRRSSKAAGAPRDRAIYFPGFQPSMTR